MSSALTYDVMKSYLTRVWDKKIRNGYITLETSCYVIKCCIKRILGKQFLIGLDETFAIQSRYLTTEPLEKSSENIVRNRESARKQQFLLFPQSFLQIQRQ